MQHSMVQDQSTLTPRPRPGHVFFNLLKGKARLLQGQEQISSSQAKSNAFIERKTLVKLELGE